MGCVSVAQHHSILSLPSSLPPPIHSLYLCLAFGMGSLASNNFISPANPVVNTTFLIKAINSEAAGALDSPPMQGRELARDESNAA